MLVLNDLYWGAKLPLVDGAAKYPELRHSIGLPPHRKHWWRLRTAALKWGAALPGMTGRALGGGSSEALFRQGVPPNDRYQ